MKQVELHIDEVVLHGFAPGDRYRIAESLGAELGRLLSEEGAPLHGGSRDEIRAGSIQVRGGDIGAQVAQAIYRTLDLQGSGNE